MKKYFILFAAFCACTLSTLAHDFEIDGIYYNFLSSDSVEVTYKGQYYNSYNNEYSGNVSIPESVIYDGKQYLVISIGSAAFSDCYNLTNITLPRSILNISSAAFRNCISLTSIIIPNSVKKIDQVAFENCYNLKGHLIIPDAVEEVGRWAFQRCSSLTSVTLGENIVSFGANTFTECSSLDTVIWNVKKCNDFKAVYNPSPFTNISSQVTSFKFGNKVQHIPSSLCESMKQLDTINIPNSVLSIGEKAFRNCSSIKEMIIPDSVSSINYATFENCTSLESITIGKNVKNFGNGNIFYGCWNLSSIIWKAIRCNDFQFEYTTPFYISNSYDIRSSIKSFTFGENVEYIPKYLCKGMKNIKYINLGNSIKAIGYSAFSELRLDSIIIPNNVDSICGHAFSGCGNLSFIKVPNNLLHLGDFAFSGCQFTQFYIPKSLSYIPQGCFYNCSKLTSIILPNNIEEIQAFAFENCTSLEQIQTNHNLKYIASSAFENCTALVSFTIPTYVQSIEKCAFKGCSSLDTIVWNAKSCQAFEHENTPFVYWKSTSNSGNFDISMNIRSITFGDSVEVIPDYLCYDLRGVTSISLPNSVCKIGHAAFAGCSNLSTMLIGTKVDTIDAYAFSGCKTLEKIEIPDSVKFIGEAAFWVCDGLQSITIGSGIENISQQAFAECKNLSSIKITALQPPLLGENAFNPIKHAKIPVDVPCESVNLYKSATGGWECFERFIANFPYSFSVSVENREQGSCEITTAPTCENEQKATFIAIPQNGYEFVSWSDGNSENPRTVEVIEDIEYIAKFTKVESAVENILVSASNIHKIFENGTIYILRNGEKYTIDGRKVK